MKLTTLDKRIPAHIGLMFVDSETGDEIPVEDWTKYEIESLIVNVKVKERK